MSEQDFMAELDGCVKKAFKAGVTITEVEGALGEASRVVSRMRGYRQASRIEAATDKAIQSWMAREHHEKT